MELEALRAKYGITTVEHQYKESVTIRYLRGFLLDEEPVFEPRTGEERIKSEEGSIEDLLNFLSADTKETTALTILLADSSNEVRGEE